MTCISAGSLLALAVVNTVILIAVCRLFVARRRGE
jgi:high-affinity nickel permease